MSNQKPHSRSFSRRAALFTIAAGITSFSRLTNGAEKDAPSTTDVKFRRQLPSNHQQQVQISVEVSGELKLNADGKEVRRLPMLVKGRLNYSERLVPDASLKTPSAAAKIWARQYSLATAKITLKDQPMEQDLRADRKLIAIKSESGSATLFSPMGPLTREELELIDVPFGTTQLSLLLPNTNKGIVAGSSWKLTDNDATAFLCLENVAEQNLSVTLKEIKAEEALGEVQGKVQGSVGGVSTDMQVTATFAYTLASQQITWLNGTIHEDRAIGHAQPGYIADTQLKIVVHPVPSLAELTDKTLADLPLEANVGTTLIDFQTAEGKFELAHDRRWRTMLDGKDLAVLRMIDHGDLVAQCNISRLPPLPKGSQLTLEGFQADIRKSLAKSFGQFLEAGQSVNERGLRVLRVVVSGTTSELPIQWTYFHVSDEAGNRATLALTMDAQLVEKFAAIDKQLISGFAFTGTPEAQPEALSNRAATKPTVPAKTLQKK